LPGDGGKDRQLHAAGNGKDPRSARGDDSPLSVWSGWRQRKNAGGRRPEVRRDPRTRPPDSKHRADQTSQDDRKTRSREKVTAARREVMTDPKITPADLQRAIRNIPDFPQPGIQFKDITPVLADARLLAGCVDLLTAHLPAGSVDAVVGIDARGFIFAAAAAMKLRAGFVPVRKKGKLPHKTYEQSYDLEYGSNTIAIHVDAFQPGSRVLLVDDLLATGG